MTFISNKMSSIFDVIQINYRIAKFFGIFLDTIKLKDVKGSKTTTSDYAGFIGYFLLYVYFEWRNYGLTTYLESTNSEITKIGFVLGRFFITTAVFVIFLLMFFNRKRLSKIIYNVHLVDLKVNLKKLCNLKFTKTRILQLLEIGHKVNHNRHFKFAKMAPIVHVFIVFAVTVINFISDIVYELSNESTRFDGLPYIPIMLVYTEFWNVCLLLVFLTYTRFKKINQVLRLLLHELRRHYNY